MCTQHCFTCNLSHPHNQQRDTSTRLSVQSWVVVYWLIFGRWFQKSEFHDPDMPEKLISDVRDPISISRFLTSCSHKARCSGQMADPFLKSGVLTKFWSLISKIWVSWPGHAGKVDFGCPGPFFMNVGNWSRTSEIRVPECPELFETSIVCVLGVLQPSDTPEMWFRTSGTKT